MEHSELPLAQYPQDLATDLIKLEQYRLSQITAFVQEATEIHLIKAQHDKIVFSTNQTCQAESYNENACLVYLR